MIGGMAIVSTFLVLRVVNEFASVSIFALNLTTGARARAGDRLQPVHRLALPRGDRRRTGRAAAMRRTMRTAGRTVFFSR